MQPVITPLDSVIGAEVTALSLEQSPDSNTVKLIEDALEKYEVLVIRDQHIAPAQQVAFSKALATLEYTTHLDARHAEHPEIFVVGNTGKKTGDIRAGSGLDRTGMARRSYAARNTCPRVYAVLPRHTC